MERGKGYFNLHVTVVISGENDEAETDRASTLDSPTVTVVKINCFKNLGNIII